MQPAFGALFYCIVITVEKCKYSCGYMNPAVVLASHVVWGQTMMKSKKIFSIERILRLRNTKRNRPPYVYGAVLGSLTTAVVAKAIDMATSVSSSGVVNGSKKAPLLRRRQNRRRRRLKRRRQQEARGRGKFAEEAEVTDFVVEYYYVLCFTETSSFIAASLR